jgi:hypothetical protein
MSIVRVYRFEQYDVVNDEWNTSRRWATEETIREVGARRVGSPIEVDESVLGAEVTGMTNRDFNPNASGGFQQTVRRGY